MNNSCVFISNIYGINLWKTETVTTANGKNWIIWNYGISCGPMNEHDFPTHRFSCEICDLQLETWMNLLAFFYVLHSGWRFDDFHFVICTCSSDFCAVIQFHKSACTQSANSLVLPVRENSFCKSHAKGKGWHAEGMAIIKMCRLFSLLLSVFNQIDFGPPPHQVELRRTHTKVANSSDEGPKNNTERITDNYAKCCYFRIFRHLSFSRPETVFAFGTCRNLMSIQ